MRAMSVFLVLAFALAGCSDDPAAPADPDVALGEDGEPLAAIHDVNLVGDPAFLEETFTGSFQFANDFPSGLLGDPVVQEHDISSLIGDGPQFVTASVQGDVQIGFAADDNNQIWTFSADDFGAPTQIEAAVGPGGLAVQVFYRGTAPAELAQHVQAIDYTLTVTVERDPMRVPSGMALEVELPGPGSSVLFTGDGTVPTVLVYDSDDRYVGTLDGAAVVEMTLDENATDESFVFVPQGHGSFYQLQVATVGQPATYTPQARLVTQTLDGVVSESLEAATEHDVTWDFSIPEHPLQAGICLGVEAGSNLWLSLVGPQGDVAQVALNQPLEFGSGSCDFTVMGAAELAAGDYALSYTDEGSEGASIQAFVVHYQR